MSRWLWALALVGVVVAHGLAPAWADNEDLEEEAPAPDPASGDRRVSPPPNPKGPLAADPRYRAAAQAIDAIMADPRYKGLALGVYAESLAPPESSPDAMVVAYNDRWPMNPASNIKLFSTATALAKLGPTFRARTEFYGERKPAGGNGTLKGPLYVKGYGDPLLVNEKLYMIAGELRLLGIEKIEGGIIVDDTFFAQVGENPGFDREQGLSKAYLAAYSATSFNFNAVTITATPAGVGQPPALYTDPPLPYFTVKNKAETGDKRTLMGLETQRDGDRTRIAVKGRLNSLSAPKKFARKVFHPELYMGHAVQYFLGQRGIEVKGPVRAGKVPSGQSLLYTHYSPTLAEMIQPVNKVSNNFVAEQLMLVTGAQVFGGPADWDKGLRAVRDFLMDDVGLTEAEFTLVNGSGLSDFSRFTPRGVVALLRTMWNRPETRPEFLASLTIAGGDGTLASRLEGLLPRGRLRAKTGSLDGVAALSGYTVGASGEPVAFSIMVAHEDLTWRELTDAIDRIATALTLTPDATAATAR
jgi:serine-type D-Ala-D-Ala carboxypeptidase/endopeptidase (penicillin-binding protein 4)